MEPEMIFPLMLTTIFIAGMSTLVILNHPDIIPKFDFNISLNFYNNNKKN